MNGNTQGKDDVQMKIDEKDYIQTTRNEQNVVVFDANDSFGHTDAVGYQYKDAAYIDGQKRFVKLDDINPASGKYWKDAFDYQYSSVSDAIVSCLVKNMEHDPKFESVVYTFEHFDNRGTLTTGTASENFLQDREVEHILAIGRDTSSDTLLSIEDYADIIDSPGTKRLSKLIDIYESDHMPAEDAKHFLVQQAGFDLLTGNQDRINNPSNFVLAFNTDTKTARPVNLDYGRCLQMHWTKTMEERFDFDSEFVDVTIEEATHDLLSSNGFDGLIPSFDELKEQGFQPFNIDKQGLYDDLDHLAKKVESEQSPCAKFAKVKIEAFKRSLEADKNKELWNDTSLSLDLGDLNEQHVL